MNRTLIACALMALACSNAALAAGQVDVSFKPVGQLADIGHGSLDAERNLKSLTEHFKSLAARLPDGRTLTVEVLDVNLAGEMRPTRNGNDLRVLRGRADWPTLDLRWTLSGDGRTLASGEDRLADMAYLSASRPVGHDGPLPYETRMIDRWFADRVAASPAR
jgi:hypothetical protein